MRVRSDNNSTPSIYCKPWWRGRGDEWMSQLSWGAQKSFSTI